eukprot:2326827-Karenia_brevis.AAC.1
MYVASISPRCDVHIYADIKVSSSIADGSMPAKAMHPLLELSRALYVWQRVSLRARSLVITLAHVYGHEMHPWNDLVYDRAIDWWWLRHVPDTNSKYVIVDQGCVSCPRFWHGDKKLPPPRYLVEQRSAA